MPFSEGMDLTKLVELRTLEGHSNWVRCGVHCTFVMIWLRRRSWCVAVFRTGGASCLGRSTTRSRCGTWRPANAWRRWKGTRTGSVRVAAFPDPLGTFVMMWLRRRSIGVAVFPDGRRVVSASWDKTLKVWDVATGECVATLEGHSKRALRGVRCTFVMIWLRRRSMALPCFRTGGASCLGRATRRSRSGTWRPANAWRRCEGHSSTVRCGVHCMGTFVMIWLRRRSMASPCSPDGRRVVSASGDKTLKVWDVATGKCVATLEGPQTTVRCGVRCTFVMIA